MIIKSFPIAIRTEEEAALLESLPKGERTRIIMELIRGYVADREKEENDDN